jgi:hypothetical protein
MTERKRRRPRWTGLVWLGLLAAAVAQELRRPAEDRTWQGKVGGVVPYDFRRPTAARVRERLWNPEGSLVVAQPFGMGWTLNVGKLLGSLRRRQDTP